MPSLSHVLWRLLVASLGFIAAIAASLALLLLAALLLPGLAVTAGDTAAATTGALVQIQRAALLLPIMAQIVWPAWLVAILATEILGLRALAIHLFALPMLAAVGVVATTDDAPGAFLRSAIASGFVAGFAHWLVAGRNAGFAMPRTQNPPEGDPRSPHA